MSAAAGTLWTGPEIVAAVQGVSAGVLPEAIAGVSIDSRTIQPGDLFIALSGPNFDGNDFVGLALQNGAALALASRHPNGHTPSPVIVAADTQQALEALGRTGRARSSAHIAAITGSVGKTSSKEMLAAVLAASGKTHFSKGSFNNHWGVPLSLARMPRDCAYAVFELGMNHAGEIDALTRLVRPHAAIVTTIAPAHLEFFDSVDAIARAKAEIFHGMDAGGTAILNADNRQFELLSDAARSHGLHVLPFGAGDDAEARLTGVTPDESGSVIEAVISGRALRYRLRLAGAHMALNSVAVLAAAQTIGADIVAGAAALSALEPLAGRGRRQPIPVADGSAVLIDESYNASPAAMQAALAVLGQTPPKRDGRRIAVLGDMRELGCQARELHADLAAPIEQAGIDLVFTVGPLMAALWERLPQRRRGAHAETAAALYPILVNSLRPGDVLTVKGSLGTRMADIVKPLIAGEAGFAGQPL